MVWIVLSISGSLGLLLCLIGLRGRPLGDGPECRRCRFSLAGLYPGARNCPECGAEVTHPRAVRPRPRRKRRVPLVAGSILLLMSAAAGGALLWSSASGFDWNTVKPVWLLVREAGSLDPGRAEPALRELNARLAAGSLNRSAQDLVIERALRAQSDLTTAWRPGWGDFVETLWLAGSLTEEQQRRYARGAFGLTLHARARIAADEDPAVFLHQEVRAGTQRVLQFNAVVWGVRVGDLPLGMPAIVSFGSLTSDPRIIADSRWERVLGKHQWDRGDIPWVFQWDRTLTPGVHRVDVAVEVAVGASGEREYIKIPDAHRFGEFESGPHWDFDERWAGRGAAHPVPPGAIVSWREVLSCEFHVLPPGAASVETMHDPALKEAVERALAEVQVVLSEDSQGLWVVWPLSIPNHESPVGLAFDMYWRHAEGELHVATVVMGVRFRDLQFERPRLREFDHETVDVVFRPSAAAAARTLDLRRIWGEEVVFRSVRVRKYPRR